ncbi:MAG: flagellar protein FliT [Desulfobacterota bacterium]|nr:flagellar protein FliT [Thermodesulfobacteriota bacterium]
MKDQLQKSDTISVAQGLAISQKAIRKAQEGDLAGVSELLDRRRKLLEQLLEHHKDSNDRDSLSNGLKMILGYDTFLKKLLSQQKAFLEKEIKKHNIQKKVYHRYASHHRKRPPRCIDKKA